MDSCSRLAVRGVRVAHRAAATAHSTKILPPRRRTWRSCGSEIFIRSIFAKFQAMLSDVPVNFVPPNSEERSDNSKIDTFDSAHGNFAHRGETGETRPAKKVD